MKELILEGFKKRTEVTGGGGGGKKMTEERRSENTGGASRQPKPSKCCLQFSYCANMGKLYPRQPVFSR